MDKNSLIIPGSLHTFLVDHPEIGLRLDSFLGLKFPNYSRSFLQKLIKDNLITINKKSIKKSATTLKLYDSVTLTVPEKSSDPIFNEKNLSCLKVKIVFQNDDFAIIYKPAGLIVHSNHAKMTDPTLVEWLRMTFPTINAIGYQDRPGIVHRLDKNTSGLMIIPLTNPAFAIFSALFKDRHIHKTYVALVKGHPESAGVFSGAIARHPTVRNKMTLHTNGRSATTHFKVLHYFKDNTLVEVKPITGRTHQIRVHFAAAGYPLIGDEIYGSRSPLINRHALHAQKLAFEYDKTPYEFEVEAPEDFKKLIEKL